MILIAYIWLLLLLEDPGSSDYHSDRSETPKVGQRVSHSPPFQGTVYLSSEILTDVDPTTFKGISYKGRGVRKVFDRREGWVSVNGYLFESRFDDRSKPIEVVVNPEFGSLEPARVEAEFYSLTVGRIPAVLKTQVDTLWIHKGTELFGGGNRNILIHSDRGASHYKDGTLEEALMHEGAHTSLDWNWRGIVSETEWKTAQSLDSAFISQYAQEHPETEDVAESFLPYLIVRCRPESVSPWVVKLIEARIPHRIDYFDKLQMDLSPLKRVTKKEPQ